MALFRRVFLITLVTWLMSAVSTQDLARGCEMFEGEEVCYTVPDVRLQWEDAFQYCSNLSVGLTSEVDSVLARVYTPEHQSRLEDFLSDNNITGSLWISARTEDPRQLDGNPVSQWRWVYECDNCAQDLRREKLRENAINQQGCYVDSDAVPDLDTQITGTDWNVSSCQEACLTADLGPFLYSGLQGSPSVTECWCGHAFGEYGPISGCVKDCDGYNCGGGLRNFIYRRDGQFGHWGYSQPDNVGVDNEQPAYCAASRLRDSGGTLKYRYFDIQCNQPIPFICRFNDTSICTSEPFGGFYELFDDTCVYLSNVAGALTWYNARQFCRDGGGDLITFNSYEEHEAILEFAVNNTVDVGTNQLVNIGLYRKPLLWKRVYQDAEMSYYNLGPGEPQAGDCMFMNASDGYTWKMADCTTQRNFICFQGPTDDPAPPTTAPDTSATETTSTSTRSTTTTTPGDVTGSTTSLGTPGGPGETTGNNGGLSRTEKILIGVLTSVGAILIIILIVFLVCRKKKRDETSRIAPSPKEKVDARLQASRPQTGPIWEVNDGYNDMGSTANLMYAVKEMVIPKWKKTLNKTSATEEEKVENPDMLRRRLSDTESILVPDLLIPLENSPNGAPPAGRYGYTESGSPPVTVYESPQNSRTALIRSYGSMPEWTESVERSRTTLPGEADYQSSIHGSETSLREIGRHTEGASVATSRDDDDTTESIPEDIESVDLSSNSERSKSLPVLDDPLGAGQLVPNQDAASLSPSQSDPDTSSNDENSLRGSDVPLVRQKSRDFRT